MAPPAWVERAETSASVYAGSGCRCRTAQMRDVMSDGTMYRKGVVAEGRTAFKVVSRVAPCERKVSTRRITILTGHREGWPERPWPMRSLRTTFFRVVKVNVTKVAARRSASGPWRVSKAREPTHNWTSRSRNI